MNSLLPALILLAICCLVWSPFLLGWWAFG